MSLAAPKKNTLRSISKYWIFQLSGWTLTVAISLFFVITIGKYTPGYLQSLLVTCGAGLIITHIMRIQIHAMKILQKSLKMQIIYFILLSLLYAVIFGITSEVIDTMFGLPERLEKFSRPMRILLSSFNALWFIVMWNFIYFFYHYAQRNRQQQLDTLRLEATVKSLELKTIKSHINPHFIFNALNSIRALVDENPTRARKAITELSNILRSSMSAEKDETVPLQQELNIVKDYLELEHMRFEERLTIHMDIDEDTLQQPIPPMMLQTLVENAIKHGISKQMYGGEINISSKIVDQELKLKITNTGQLMNGKGSREGFGIKSTQDRLNLLYNGKANFDIRGLDDNRVMSTISMPLVTVL